MQRQGATQGTATIITDGKKQGSAIPSPAMGMYAPVNSLGHMPGSVPTMQQSSVEAGANPIIGYAEQQNVVPGPKGMHAPILPQGSYFIGK